MSIFDLEQEILNCWRVVEDVDLVYNYEPAYSDRDCMQNSLLGIQQLYNMRFEKLWAVFEQHCKEHHQLRKGVLQNVQ